MFVKRSICITEIDYKWPKRTFFIDVKENENIVQNGTYRKLLDLHWFAENVTFEYNFTDIIKLEEVLPTAKATF